MVIKNHMKDNQKLTLWLRCPSERGVVRYKSILYHNKNPEAVHVAKRIFPELVYIVRSLSLNWIRRSINELSTM